MKPLRTRDDLLSLVNQLAPTRACARATTTGRVTLFGGFTPVEQLPCFILKIEATTQSWLVKVECDEAQRRYRISYIDAVPWCDWIGRANDKRPLIGGDDPKFCYFQRLNARTHASALGST